MAATELWAAAEALAEAKRRMANADAALAVAPELAAAVAEFAELAGRLAVLCEHSAKEGPEAISGHLAATLHSASAKFAALAGGGRPE